MIFKYSLRASGSYFYSLFLVLLFSAFVSHEVQALDKDDEIMDFIAGIKDSDVSAKDLSGLKEELAPLLLDAKDPKVKRKEKEDLEELVKKLQLEERFYTQLKGISAAFSSDTKGEKNVGALVSAKKLLQEAKDLANGTKDKPNEKVIQVSGSELKAFTGVNSEFFKLSFKIKKNEKGEASVADLVWSVDYSKLSEADKKVWTEEQVAASLEHLNNKYANESYLLGQTEKLNNTLIQEKLYKSILGGYSSTLASYVQDRKKEVDSKDPYSKLALKQKDLKDLKMTPEERKRKGLVDEHDEKLKEMTAKFTVLEWVRNNKAKAVSISNNCELLVKAGIKWSAYSSKMRQACSENDTGEEEAKGKTRSLAAKEKDEHEARETDRTKQDAAEAQREQAMAMQRMQIASAQCQAALQNDQVRSQQKAVVAQITPMLDKVIGWITNQLKLVNEKVYPSEFSKLDAKFPNQSLYTVDIDGKAKFIMDESWNQSCREEAGRIIRESSVSRSLDSLKDLRRKMDDMQSFMMNLNRKLTAEGSAAMDTAAPTLNSMPPGEAQSALLQSVQRLQALSMDPNGAALVPYHHKALCMISAIDDEIAAIYSSQPQLRNVGSGGGRAASGGGVGSAGGRINSGGSVGVPVNPATGRGY